MQTPDPVNLTVSVAFSATWRDVDATMGTLAVGSWTDITPRLLSFTMDRGRQDRTANFEPGTINLTLDGTDRMLDPLYSSSLVYALSGTHKGGPLTPIKVDATYQGFTYRIFSGYLSGELWRNRRTAGQTIEVEVSAVDRMGLFAQLDLPGSPFEATVRSTYPDWWIRGIGGDLFAGNGSPIIDSSDNPFYSVISGGGGQVVFLRKSMIAGDSDSAMAMTSNVQVSTGASGATAATAELTAFCMWQGSPSGADQSIMVQQNGSTVRWKVVCNNTGQIVMTVYNSGGSATAFVGAPANPASGGRWDDNRPHAIMAVFAGGVSIAITVDGLTASPATGTFPATTAGAFIFGSSGNPASFDEVAWWRRILTTDETAALFGSASGTAYGFGSQSVSTRIAWWWNLARVPADALEAFYAHHVPFGTDSLLPMSTVPNDLAAAVRRTIESFGGVAWTARDGRVRVRTASALTDASYASSYATPLARLSDAVSVSGTPPVVRRSAVKWSGVRTDRLINVSSVDWNGSTFEARNVPSVTRYGARQHRFTSDATSPLSAFSIAAAEVARYGSPQVELEPVQIDPTVDAAATTFLLANCELERAVTVVDTPMVGPVITMTMNVQGEHWRWQDGTDWTVTLNLAPS